METNANHHLRTCQTGIANHDGATVRQLGQNELKLTNGGSEHQSTRTAARCIAFHNFVFPKCK